LAQKCRELLSELNVIYNNKQVECTVDISENLNIKVDPFYFEMALRNLLDNALKYSETPAKVEITVKKYAKELYIYVSDSGNGIPKKEQKKVFREFYRADSKNKGHGIGLAFTRQAQREDQAG